MATNKLLIPLWDRESTRWAGDFLGREVRKHSESDGVVIKGFRQQREGPPSRQDQGDLSIKKNSDRT